MNWVNVDAPHLGQVAAAVAWARCSLIDRAVAANADDRVPNRAGLRRRYARLFARFTAPADGALPAARMMWAGTNRAWLHCEHTRT